jgi:hypothetical protein
MVEEEPGGFWGLCGKNSFNLEVELPAHRRNYVAEGMR